MDSQMKLKLSEHPWETCDCGSMEFRETILVKRISGILTGTGETQHIPVPALMCCSCNKIPSFILAKMPEVPVGLRAKKLDVM